jgi:hypothetical protein
MKLYNIIIFTLYQPILDKYSTTIFMMSILRTKIVIYFITICVVYVCWFGGRHPEDDPRRSKHFGILMDLRESVFFITCAFVGFM